MHSTDHTVHLSRRRLLLLLGGSVAGAGLLAVTGTASADASVHDQHTLLDEAVAAVLAPTARSAPSAAPRMAPFEQAAHAGFSPINSSLTFGPPADLASGWDGTVWAIDGSGAPHVYDPLADTWQLHGTGIGGAALIEDTGPAVYFRGGEVFIADGRTSADAIAMVWPQLPASYRKFGVKGAAWAAGKLVLFRGGTYLTVPWTGGSSAPHAIPMPEVAHSQPIYHDALQAASTTTATATPAAGAAPTRSPTPAATPTPAVSASPTPPASFTPTPTPTPDVSGTPTPARTRTATATATSDASPSPTRAASLTPTTTTTPTPASASAPTVPDYVASALTDIAGWPQAANWQHGVIDGVYSQGNNVVLVIRGSEFVTLSFTAGMPPTASGPTPLSQHVSFASLPTAWVSDGFDAGFFVAAGPYRDTAYAYKGPQLVVYQTQIGAEERAAEPIQHAVLLAADSTPSPVASSTPLTVASSTSSPVASGTPSEVPSSTPSTVASSTPSQIGSATPTPAPAPHGALVDLLRGSPGPKLYYAPAAAAGWPATWHPVLQHAPSGRTSGLWAATVQGSIVNFDGSVWTLQPGAALSVAAGQDGSVFAIDKQNQQQLSQWSGSGWSPVAQHAAALSQVSVGAQHQVWTRDGNNAVHQLSQGQLKPVTQLGSAAHIAASQDSTLWSCTGSDSHALRLASDLNQAPDAVPVAGNVQKVASTGFGVAHCLAAQNGSAQLYRYDSPYVFRTPASYTFVTGDPIEGGLGSLFFTVQQGRVPTYQVVAVDAHTGQELSRSAAAPTGLYYTPPAFDALHETVIVGLTTDNGLPDQPGRVLGLDARDLSQVRWTLTLPNAPGTSNPMPLGPGRPTLQGTQLCVSDNFNTLVMYDTGSAATATTPTHQWTSNFPPPTSGDAHRLPPPVLANGNVYAAWWLWSNAYGFLQLWLWKLDAATGNGTQTALPYFYPNLVVPTSNFWFTMGRVSPLLEVLPGTQAGQSRQVMFVNGGTSVWSVDVNAATGESYRLPGNQSLPNAAVSGLGFADGVLWFGDDVGSLYGLDDQLKPVSNTPAQISAGQILATPVPYTDSQGQSAVLLSVWDQNASLPGLLAFDPTSGNVTTIPTQGTALVTLSSPTNGVIYGGGSVAVANTSSATPAQVYAIRVDGALQGLRDFIVDSQLLQDFDDPSQATHNDKGVARYQTHLTLVDNSRAPLANQPVKIWADKSTSVLINGQRFTIGPGDDQFAAVTAPASGTLVIVSGYTRVDGSDKTDMAAAPLRVWASFMDPYERLLVSPDREYHNRVATAHAASADQPGADDPGRANLQTAQTYGDLKNQGNGTSNPLFTDQQKQDNQPQQVARVIQTMTGSVGTTPPAGSKTLAASFALHATDAAGKYISYTDTPGAQYSPFNIAANRAAVVLQTTGLSYSRDNAGTQAPSFTMLSPPAATVAIDALEGADWSTSRHAPGHVQDAARTSANASRVQLGDFWSDFWDWLKDAAATITHIIISVAEDVYAGIRLIIDNVVYVFNTIVAGIEQVADAIGAFFIELGHLIEEVIEALSVLFQFGHVIDTHNILKGELLKRINGDGSTAYPGLASIVSNSALPQVDAFFEQGEQAITDAVNGLADALAGSKVTQLQGSGATAHSAFSATPKSGGASSSNATQGSWALNKFNGGIGSGGASATSGQQLLSADDPISAFFNTFAARLSGDGDLSSQWARVQSGAQGLANAGSAADFIKQGLAELLRLVALLLDSALAVSNAFVDGLLGTIGNLIQTLFAPDSNGNPTDGGILSMPLEIPVLSWLYQLLFGEPLTLLNALTLVIAIPVTILWRVVEGQWPSDSLGVGAASRLGEVGAAPQILQQLMTWASAIGTMCLGIIYAAGDTLGEAGGPPILGRAALAGSLLVSLCGIPTFVDAEPGRFDWATWGLGLGTALLNILGSIDFNPEAGLAATFLGSFALSVMSLALVGVMGAEFGVDPPPDLISKAVLGIDMAALLPGLINTWKLTGVILAAVVAVADVVMGFAGAVAILLSGLA